MWIGFFSPEHISLERNHLVKAKIHIYPKLWLLYQLSPNVSENSYSPSNQNTQYFKSLILMIYSAMGKISQEDKIYSPI